MSASDEVWQNAGTSGELDSELELLASPARHYRGVADDATVSPAAEPAGLEPHDTGSEISRRDPLVRASDGSPDGGVPSTDKVSLRRRLRRLGRRIAKSVVARVGPFVLRRLSRTWTVAVLGNEHLEAARSEGGGHFMALWHGRMVVALPHYGGRGWHVLVSPSQDGDISEALLEGFGYRVIRGSSSRGGARALREMLTVLENGAVLVVTPDGPRGPRHSMNPGLAWMARATGFAVVPCGFVCDRAWQARSWDRFTIPKPKARVTFIFGEPVRVARSASPEELEAATERIRTGMLDAELRGFEYLQETPDW